MEFNKAYNRREFINFLQNSFLPNDFIPTEEQVVFSTQIKHATEAVKLGSSETLDLVVYEIKHTSKNDARVALSKEAFRMLADEMEDRALVVFVPEDNCDNYRFSFIEISLDIAEGSSRITRNYSNPRRYSYLLGKDIAYYTPNKYLNSKGRVVNDEDLHSRFSVEVLTKDFYNELSDWYAWAIKIIRFPNDINDDNDDDKYNNESAIRLITRLIFVWFLKQRHLIPNEFFDEKYIADNLITGFNPHAMVDLFSKSNDSKYYKAILQNLFFAMLNSPITAEGSSELSERHFRSGRGDYDNNKLMRYESYFSNPQRFVELANHTVPFLNGGLFDCLDDKDNDMYYDGFSDREAIKKSLIVPDYLFFGEEVGKNIDLSEWYGDKKKKRVSARGIIDILKRYNFTVEENTPFDKEVSLDPELLGKVFENLLASFNPETQTTARKQTGSFYTPREIVQYMVDESLIAHLKRTVGEELEPKLRQLLQYTDDTIDLTEEQCKSIMTSLYNCKILDPACGSGAFPMGILQQMVHILGRIDPNNTQWKEMMMTLAIDETTEAFKNASSEERSEQIKDIERSFDEGVNRPDYARKLYLIENCIYGVDIQPIAIQISKLRFFISLIVDQKTNNSPADNFGVRPLPNLEAKFVAANTLVGLESELSLADNAEVIINLKKQLRTANHKIFSAKTVRTKRKYKQQVVELRQAIATNLHEMGFIDNSETEQLASWDMFDQNASSSFFDPEWMFGVKGGFDIVIANPPYVLVQTLSSSSMSDYYKKYYTVANYKVDLYHLFIEQGIRLLVSGGSLLFINPSNFLTNNYTEGLRRFLLEKNTMLNVLNIETNVFNASVNTCIIDVMKGVSEYTLDYYHGKMSGGLLKLDLLSSASKEDYLSLENILIQPFGNKDESKLIKKIASCNETLSNYCSVKFGMQLRNRKLYTSDVLQNPSIDEITNYHRKCLTGKDVVPYSSNYNNLYCYFNRDAKCGGCWDEAIHNATEKVLVRQVGSIPICGIDINGYAILNSVFMIVGNTLSPFYVMAIINSKLIRFYWHNVFEDRRITFPKIKGSYLEKIPFKKPVNNIIEDLSKLIYIKKEENSNTTIEEQEIDYLVYKLYNLTYEEVLLVDPETLITKEEYNIKR